MKNLAITLTCLSLILPLDLFCQIKVNASGQVGINNTSPSYQLDVVGTTRFTNTGNYSLLFNYGSFYPSSGLCSLGTIQYYWNYLFVTNPYFYNSPVITSDQKNKTDIRELDNSSSNLLLLKPVKYKLNPKLIGDPKSDSIQIKQANVDQYGFLAQDLQQLLPDLVSKDEEGTLGIKYIELIPLLVKGFQEQQIQIDSLQVRVHELEKGK
jgi:hypothetical protein